jgi:4-aminobutyrate aminotransferase-like enzyme
VTTRQVLALLRKYESRNVTFVEPDGSWPIIWTRAKGVRVWDAEGRKYLDLSAAFGVAAAGHANPRVVEAGRLQMGALLHAMGDVHPHPLKARLARELSRITFERWRGPHRPAANSPPASAKTIFCNSGFEAVEAALKTAMLATGKPGVIAFEGAYHGLGYGALNATHRGHFRHPFRAQIRKFGHFVPFPGNCTPFHARPSTGAQRHPRQLDPIESRIREIFRRRDIGAILVEPVQVRGGIHIPPPEFLPLLRRVCDDFGALLILDEVYTGFGRTGKWFACEHSTVIPDVICLGKALTGGFPLSACVGRAELMDAAWPASKGEAIHTSTFLGHPVGCAMALAQIAELRRLDLIRRSAELGTALLEFLRSELSALGSKTLVRGLGLLAGVELRSATGAPATAASFSAVKTMLRRGFILLPEGEHGNVISFTPPLIIKSGELQGAVTALGEVLTAKDRTR